MDALADDPLAAAIALAAIATGDEDAASAALDPGLRERVERVRVAIRSVRERSRESAALALVSAIAPRVGPESEALPLRARAVLATLAPRELGAEWIRRAGAPRVAFRASASLRTTLACTDEAAWRA